MTRSLHPFPARMAPEIVSAAIAKRASSRPPNRVIDPMCGSGTVLRWAQNAGLAARGMDLDPLALRMSTVSTTTIDADDLCAAARVAAHDAARSSVEHPDWFDEETSAFAAFWFGPQQRKELTQLAVATSKHEECPLKWAIQLAISRLIITKTPKASLAADTSHSRPHRVIRENSFDVLKEFERSIERLSKHVGASRTKVEAVAGDARDPEAYPEDPSDLVITSPPYLNAIDYMRGHRLALIWMGYTMNQLRQIRRKSVGAERNATTVSAFSQDIVDTIENEAVAPNNIPKGIVARYAEDLLAVANAIEKSLSSHGEVIMVVADSRVRGNTIPNGEIVSQALAWNGLKVVEIYERSIPASHRYLPMTGDSQLTSRMKTEYVITAERN